jgi:hypothetical protein
MRAAALISSILMGLAFTGCARVAPLDDARLIDVQLASPADLARRAQAQQQLTQEQFGGASFSDGKGHVTAAFLPGEYDAFLIYARTQPELATKDAEVLKPQWPTLRLAFQSRRVLFDSSASVMPDLFFYLCGEGHDKGRLFGWRTEIMWRNRSITAGTASEIEASLKDGASSQDYEVFFDYVYWDMGRARQRGEPAVLLPLSDDLCMSFYKFDMPFPTIVGRPMRIDKDIINGTLRPLPRSLPVNSGN